MLHERKFQSVHERFWQHLLIKMPNLKCTPEPVVVDKEIGITNAIAKTVSNLPILHCWNHLKQDFMFWLGKQKLSSDQKNVYTSDLDSTLDSDSKEKFIETCETLTAKWSKPVVDYFEKKPNKNDILKYSAKWILKQLNLCNPYSRITNNISEGMNTVVKRLVDWKEVPLHTAEHCISYLQNYNWNEILRGFCDM